MNTISNNLRLHKYELDENKRNIIKKIEKMGEISRTTTKFKKILSEDNYIAENYVDRRIKHLVDTYTYKNKHESKIIVLKDDVVDKGLQIENKYDIVIEENIGNIGNEEIK